MPPYRKIKRDYKKPFFSSRRRGLAGLPLLLGILSLGCALLAIFAFSDTLRREVQYAADSLLGIPRPTPTLFAHEYAQNGITLYQAGKLEEARAEFERAVDQRAYNVDYLYEYGKILLALDDTERAAIIGDRAMAANPDDARGYAIKARALMWSESAAAIPLAVQGLDKDPNFAPLHAVLAVAYTNIGRLAEGLQRGYRATELDSLDPFVHRAIAYPLIYTGHRDEAIAALEQAVALNPNHTAPYFELAAQYRVIGLQEWAVGIFRRILELEPDNAKAYVRICETYGEVGEFLEAARYCETATELNEDYAEAWAKLGQMQYTRRNYEGAVASLEECADKGSTAVECYYLRGLAYYYLADCSKAWDILIESFNYTDEPHIINLINRGLASVRADCSGYAGAQLPTPIPPTPIPPTPIGGI